MANTFIHDAAEFDSTAVIVDKPTTAGVSGFFKSLAERLAIMRQSRIDAEIGKFIAQNGGQLTDELERQISRRFGESTDRW